MARADDYPATFTHVIVAGSGYAGKRISAAFASNGKTVIALTRSSVVHQRGICEVNIDLDQLDCESIAVDKRWLAYYLVPPNPQQSEDARIRNFLRSALNGKPGKLILISTTGVYGNCGGRWVNEQTAVNPQTDRAKRRADVEQYAQQWARQANADLAVLRVAGIYGPKRVVLERIRQGLKLPPRSESGYSNRIHIDDLVDICIAAANPQVSGIYNVSDGMPLRMIDFMNLAAEIWGLPPVQETSDAKSLGALSETMKDYLRESRKIDNTKVLRDTGIKLRYSDPRAGLAACRRDSTEP